MTGGAGDDTYVVDTALDRVIEGAVGGIDTVRTVVNGYRLGDHVENLQLTGVAGQTGIGNDLNNILTANAKGAALQGGSGNDILVSGAGADTLTGGAGADVFSFSKPATPSDRITDFTRGEDVIDLRALLEDYAGGDPVGDGWVAFSVAGGNTTLKIDLDGQGSVHGFADVVMLTGVNGGLMAQVDWVFH